MKNKNFTLIELLVVITVIAILIAILMPTLSKAREKARRVVCNSNLRQTGIALSIYADDMSGKYPSGNAEINLYEGVQALYVQYDSLKPRQLAFLMYLKYISDDGARILYCPSWKNPYIQYDHRMVAGWGTQGGWSPDGFSSFKATGLGGAHTSYEYRGTFPDNGKLWSGAAKPKSANITTTDPMSAVITDRWLYKASDSPFMGGLVLGSGYWAHRVGYTALYMDGSTFWVKDEEQVVMNGRAWIQAKGKYWKDHEAYGWVKMFDR